MAPRDIHIDLGQHSAPHRRAAMTPQERAQRDAASIGGEQVEPLFLTSAGCAFLAWCFMLYMVVRSTNKIELMLGGAVGAMIASVLIWRLPITALMMERTYPEHARIAKMAWACVVLFALVAIVFYFVSTNASESEVVLLMLAIVVILACGILPMWATMATSESYRLAHGDIGPPQPAAPIYAQPQLEGGGAMSQDDVFSMWQAHRLIPNPRAKVSSTDAYSDYAATCDLNGVQPMTQARFFAELKRLAMGSDGRIAHSKIKGNMFYHGWSLPIDLHEVGHETMERIPAPR
jgi:hypothetical protein